MILGVKYRTLVLVPVVWEMWTFGLEIVRNLR